jgi:hypothetical protein
MRRSMFVLAPDGGEGAGGEGGAGGGEGGEGGQGGATFTPEQQAQVDRIVRDRLARQKAQFADYEDLKNKASEYDKIAESNKTELQKAQERAAQAERTAAEAQERAQRTLTEAAITAAATGKLADPTDALALVDRSAIEYGTDGTPTNIGELVASLVESKPHLAAGTRKAPPIDQGARGGSGDVLDPAHMSDADFMAALRDPAKLAAINAAQK